MIARPAHRYGKSKFMLTALVVVIVIAVLAPFLASSNPDGLESTASNFEEAEEADVYEAPMPDYIIPVFGEGGASGVVAMIIGIVLTLLLVFVITVGLRRWRAVEKKAKK